MASQLIYTKSRAVHGNLAQRICRAVKPGYAVVGKTRMSSDLESMLVSLARHGIEKRSMDLEPQFLYLPDFTSRGIRHIFGSVRWAKRGGVTSADYIAHFLVLTEEEVRKIWQSSCRLTPAGILLVLELSGLWAESWRGTARWLTNENLPNWAEAEETLQAQVQPTWQYYTGHKHFAALLKSPQYREACMLALPAGTPVIDMLRLLHEADSLRSDMGWSIPVSTLGSEQVVELTQVQLLGYIGSRMQRQATLAGIPVIEVTEKLVDAAETPNVQPAAPPPVFTPPQVEKSAITSGGEEDEASAPPPTHLLSKLLRLGGALLILGGAVICGQYVWNNRAELREHADKAYAQTQELGQTEHAKNEAYESATQSNDEEVSTGEKVPAHGDILPVQVGQAIPNCLKQLFSDIDNRLDSGKVAIYHLHPNEQVNSLSHDLDGNAYRAIISPGDGEGKWELRLLEQDKPMPGGKVTITTEDNTLRDITDEEGKSVALLLPIPQGDETTGEVLLLPEVRIALPAPEGKRKAKADEADKLTELTPEHLNCGVQKQKLSLASSPQAKKWEMQLQGNISYTAQDLVRLPAVAARNKVTLVEQNTQLCRLPERGERRGGMLFYSPKLKISYDLRQEVIAHMLRFAHATHSVSTQKKLNPHSLAGAYCIVTRILEAPKDKRTEAIRQYANLFADEKFTAFCEKELSYMPRPYRGGVSGSGARIQVKPEVMEQLMVANYRDIQLDLCERLTKEARTEFSLLLQAQRDAAISGKELVLREVQVTGPDELTWSFEVSGDESQPHS